MVNARDIVSIVELIFYTPTALFATFICLRHGFHRTSGWIYTLLLCLIRIAGAIAHLIASHNPTVGAVTANIILDSIGISPLLLATLGLLSRL
jgi:predicted signal transduction protein with EAL and GGDEF domain